MTGLNNINFSRTAGMISHGVKTPKIHIRATDSESPVKLPIKYSPEINESPHSKTPMEIDSENLNLNIQPTTPDERQNPFGPSAPYIPLKIIPVCPSKKSPNKNIIN